ncbi:hypothetical protein T439DRAFT_329696 [Meredithblackwellia eburnea MCA 4105]
MTNQKDWVKYKSKTCENRRKKRNRFPRELEPPRTPNQYRPNPPHTLHYPTS